jgi:hypothetical protein
MKPLPSDLEDLVEYAKAIKASKPISTTDMCSSLSLIVLESIRVHIETRMSANALLLVSACFSSVDPGCSIWSRIAGISSLRVARSAAVKSLYTVFVFVAASKLYTPEFPSTRTLITGDTMLGSRFARACNACIALIALLCK